MTTDEEYNAVLPFKTPEEIADSAYLLNLEMARNGELALWRKTIQWAIERYVDQIRAYIETREHPDDWGVPCIYVKDLREALGMPPSKRRSY